MTCGNIADACLPRFAPRSNLWNTAGACLSPRLNQPRYRIQDIGPICSTAYQDALPEHESLSGTLSPLALRSANNHIWWPWEDSSSSDWCTNVIQWLTVTTYASLLARSRCTILFNALYGIMKFLRSSPTAKKKLWIIHVYIQSRFHENFQLRNFPVLRYCIN